MSFTIDDPSFVDTNIFVYLFDSDSPAKQAIARELVEGHSEKFVLSTQVLGEFFVAVTLVFDSSSYILWQMGVRGDVETKACGGFGWIQAPDG